MPTNYIGAQNVVSNLHTHFSSKAQDVANIVVGPRRESWFNAESFVATNMYHNENNEEFVVFYGEEQYQTVLEKAGYSVDALDEKDANKLPDLVGYGIKEDNSEISFVMEAKILYFGDAADGRSKFVTLDVQLKRAKRAVPDATILGIVYFVVLLSDSANEIAEDLNAPPPAPLSFDTEEDLLNYGTTQPSILIQPEPFLDRVKQAMEEAMPDTEYSWLDNGLPRFFDGLTLRVTEMPYPSATVSVGMAARILN